MRIQGRNIDAEYVISNSTYRGFHGSYRGKSQPLWTECDYPLQGASHPLPGRTGQRHSQDSAVNVIKIIRLSKGKVKLVGYNSDIIGFTQSIEPLLQPQHKKALILVPAVHRSRISRAGEPGIKVPSYHAPRRG